MELAIHCGGGVQGRQGKGRGTLGRRGKCGKVEEMEKKNVQRCLILCNQKWAKGRKPKKKVGWKPEIQGMGGGRFGSPAPLPSPPPQLHPTSDAIFLSFLKHRCVKLKTLEGLDLGT